MEVTVVHLISSDYQIIQSKLLKKTTLSFEEAYDHIFLHIEYLLPVSSALLSEIHPRLQKISLRIFLSLILRVMINVGRVTDHEICLALYPLPWNILRRHWYALKITNKTQAPGTNFLCKIAT